MKRVLRMGISTCPNDTFTFHGLLSGAVRPLGFELTIELSDVEDLNQRLLRGDFDAAKASFAAALKLSADFGVLPVGSALGFGVGPVILAGPNAAPLTGGVRNSRPRILAPGELTTATLLFRILHPDWGAPEQVRFSEIMPRLREGQADYGVCIHEGRFNFQDFGLRLVEDLGKSFEERFEAPVPLGGILARKGLGPACHEELARVIRESLDYASAHREEAFGTMRHHAQELSEAAIWAHVALYVNDWTREFGAVGRAALSALARAADVAESEWPSVLGSTQVADSAKAK